ncbi:alpha-ketoglutarate-dependent dioxygenase AlkB [Salegentibacter sp. LM13S]|uniref:alpha-ketoglutarate-dependent dioxygenase AlkB family protein n=1 Tax=Salegentibacter lacus TaxID=2873599 RepID=UPI001CD00C4B|nr:alpha-ketoglutarate-dependent dioxygenase AlkB [Salegentibacter lacus]MBZ9630450.1 alpha-ketoglutarate-dependent dioxygenase AlkB [Salegentibacter lacus]
MDLFNDNPISNILPNDGEVNYYGKILNNEDAQHYFDHLLRNIQWDNDKAIIFGKLIVTKRKAAWYGDKPFDYTYSKTTKSALPWTRELLEIKEIIEKKTGETFNSCLLNLYHSGEEGMAWHSDGEKDLKKNGAIGSLSLGADRKFSFKHKVTKHTVSVILEKGSLLVMQGRTQTNWLHRLPPTKKVKSPRINLTFRTIEV